MTLEEKLAAAKKQLEEKRASQADLVKEVRALAEGANDDAGLKAAQDKKTSLDDVKVEVKKLEDTVDLYEEAIKGKTQPADNKPGTPAQDERRLAIDQFIRSKEVGKEMNIPADIMLRDGGASDAPTTTGVVSADAKATIPEAVEYKPQRALQTVVDLKPYTNVISAKTAKGSYPVLKNATGVLHTVAELEKNPALAKPEFTPVDWSVDTYRGAIPLSQESIDDSAADLTGIVAENGRQLKLNTTNALVAGVLKTFTAKEIASIDDLKKINNVDLDPAYARAIVASQSFYNWLDTQKDGNGRYLLQDSIISPSGKSVLGMPIVVVGDDVFGAAGEGHAFLGDIKRSVLFADRADLDIQWVDNDLYGKYLRAGMRMGVAKADEAAGYFLTVTDPKA